MSPIGPIEALLWPYRNSAFRKVCFGSGNSIFIVMKNAGRQSGVGSTNGQSLKQMFRAARATAGYHRDTDRISDGSRHGQIITDLGAVRIHTR